MKGRVVGGVILVALFCCLAFIPVADADASIYSVFAKLTATLQGSAQFKQGYVRFDQISATDQRVNVTVYVEGAFPDGQYGLIVHQYGDLTDKSGASLGPHFVGGGSPSHGCPPNPNRHEGDLGNWQSAGGVISASQIFDATSGALVSLHPPHGIVGLAVALHSGADSCQASDDGGNPDVLAMGTIGIMNFDNNEAHADEAHTHNAVATLYPTTGCPACSGTVWFQETSKGVLVVAQVFGLSAAQHAFNIYWFGDLSGNADSRVGTHYNPYGRNHALPPTASRHAGDLGNIKDFSTSTSSSWYRYETTIIPKVDVLLGRAVVVGSQPDHGTGIGCDQLGNPGSALALGVIGIANPSTAVPSLPGDVNPLPNWTNLNCTVPNNVSPHADDGKTAALYIGWGLAAFFLGSCIVLIVYYYAKLRGRAGYEQF